MDSSLAREAAEAMAETVRRMTPEERLCAFASHCELMVRLRDAAIRAMSGGDPKA